MTADERKDQMAINTRLVSRLHEGWLDPRDNLDPRQRLGQVVCAPATVDDPRLPELSQDYMEWGCSEIRRISFRSKCTTKVIMDHVRTIGDPSSFLLSLGGRIGVFDTDIRSFRSHIFVDAVTRQGNLYCYRGSCVEFRCAGSYGSFFEASASDSHLALSTAGVQNSLSLDAFDSDVDILIRCRRIILSAGGSTIRLLRSYHSPPLVRICRPGANTRRYVMEKSVCLRFADFVDQHPPELSDLPELEAVPSSVLYHQMDLFLLFDCVSADADFSRLRKKAAEVVMHGESSKWLRVYSPGPCLASATS